jgi:hypothetical protein
MFLGYGSKGNDFYEPRVIGYSFRTPRRIQTAFGFESNEAKKYSLGMEYFLGLRSLFNSPNHNLSFSHMYRFSDKFSLSQRISYNPAKNDAGFYDIYNLRDASGNLVYDANGNTIFKDILFSRRDIKTVDNILSAKYNFNNKSGITIRLRHYWSKVKIKQLYDLNNDGNLSPTKHTGVTANNQNFNIFNIDAVYTLQFAPGSFVNVVFKDQDFLFNSDTRYSYFKNFSNTISEPHNNNLSLKIIYYLDYLDFKKWKKKKE